MIEKKEQKFFCGAQGTYYSDPIRIGNIYDFCIQFKGEQTIGEPPVVQSNPVIHLNLYLQVSCAVNSGGGQDNWSDMIQFDIGQDFTASTWLTSALNKATVPALVVVNYIRIKVVGQTDNGDIVNLYVRFYQKNT